VKKNDYNKKLFSLISVLASIFVYTGAIVIYFYANGWRLGNSNQLFIKTGVLTVESTPFLASLYVDGETKGRTPKSVSLPVGTHRVSLSREGYTEWIKDVEIKEQKSTPIYPWLIKEKMEEEEIFSLEGKKYVNSWMNSDSTHIYILTNEYLTDTLLYRYTLYRFDISTAFWDISSNPRVVLTFDVSQEPKVEMSLSPNGQFGILTLINTDTTNYYILDSTKSSTLETLSQVNLAPFSSYKMTWSNNSQYLIFESEEDLISFDITKQTTYLLIKKVKGEEYIWNTDRQGNFYKLEPNPEYLSYDNIYSYVLIQTQMDGSEPNTILKDLHFQKNQEYILRYQQDTGSGKYLPFTNSPGSTKSVGKVTKIVVNQEAKGIYIQTNISSYWYSIELGKYYLVSPYPSELVSFAPNNESFIYKDQTGYNIFRFIKEEGDHTVEIGSKTIKDIPSEAFNMRWLSNSLNLSYIHDNVMYVVDIDGENKVEILTGTDSNIFQCINPSSDKVFTLSVSVNETLNTNSISIRSITFR
jgi:hypothetical protein